MQRGLRPASSHDPVTARALDDHVLEAPSMYVRSWPSSLGRSRKRWLDVRTSTSCALLALQRGLSSSVVFISLPQLSHWSPRASSYLQKGHVPSMKRSARNLAQPLQYTCNRRRDFKWFLAMEPFMTHLLYTLL
jgi:hypothetical protein